MSASAATMPIAGSWLQKLIGQTSLGTESIENREVALIPGAGLPGADEIASMEKAKVLTSLKWSLLESNWMTHQPDESATSSSKGIAEDELWDLLGEVFEHTAADAAAHSVELRDALADLDEVTEEARTEGYPEPSADTIELARRLLRGMYGWHRARYEIYPTEDGEVTIHGRGGAGASVLVLCHAAEGVLCLVNLDGSRHRRAVYMPQAVASLPDGFIREALLDLGAST